MAAILVFDMPRFKRLETQSHAPCSNAADVSALALREAATQKNGPKIGAIRRKYYFAEPLETKEAIAQTSDSRALETEVRQVAVTRCDAGTGHQQAVDGRHQAA